MKRLAAALSLLLASCNPAIAAELDRLEVKEAAAPAMCPVAGMPLPMPCAFAYAMMQKLIGGGCGERTCPVRL